MSLERRLANPGCEDSVRRDDKSDDYCDCFSMPSMTTICGEVSPCH